MMSMPCLKQHAWFAMHANSAAWFYLILLCIKQMTRVNPILILAFLVDTADGKTTSPQSPPHSLCKPYNIPTSSSPATSHTRSVPLDRSKSAPASIHQPPETSFSSSQSQEETKSHPSVTPDMTEYNPPFLQEEPMSPPPQSLAESSPQNPVHELVDAFEPQSQPVTNSALPNNEAAEACIQHILPAQEPLSSTVSKDNEATDLVTCGESVSHLDTDVGEDISLQETKDTESPFTNLNTSSQTGAQLEEVDMLDSTDAKTIGLDIPDQLQEKEQDSIMKNLANNQVHHPTPVSELTYHHSLAGPASSSELPPVYSEFEKSTDARSASKSAVPSERDQPEGASIPSLAQALKELHELLMSNTHAQACGRISPSASHSTSTKQDAEGVDQVLATEDYASLDPTVESSSHTAATNETTFAKSEHAAQADGGTIDTPTLSSKGQEDDQTNGVANIRVEQDTLQSQYIPEGNQVGGNEGASVSEPERASPLQGFFEFRETPESQRERGDAEWRNLGTEHPNSAEPSQQRPLSVAVGSSADDSSLVPVASSHLSTQALESAPLPFSDSIQPSALTLMGQYPAEHIERIQAAGFSSLEAAEALDQAEGSVELALLVLLARKITVPT
ncbi:uncharacterized protein [Salminus brasiliensis]|uniref:uncharacterized protein n=1 Tax=Salminus brasiliensis TaxID=930266 RepID=UPI003B82E3BA